MPDTAAAQLAIFRAGRHTAVDGRTLEFSAADIAAIAASYDPAASEAPLVIGHPKLEAPAFGWVKALSARDGILYAEPQQVEAQFAESVNAGRFKKISASIYLPDSPGNPTPGKLYLRHVGFLGAATPAVKGLRSAQFAEGDGAAEFADSWSGADILGGILTRLREWFIEREGVEKANQVISRYQIQAIEDAADSGRADSAVSSFADSDVGTTLEHDMPNEKQTADFAEREAALSKQQTALEAREKALADMEAKARREGAAEFAEGLVKAGKLLPREKAPVVELLLALPVEPVSFAEGDATVSKPGAEVLCGLLEGLPQRVDYAEKSGAQNAAAPVSFAMPSGDTVDAAQLEVHRKAKAYQAEHANVDYMAAVRAVGG